MSTWILLRGLTRESRHWGRFPDILRTELSGIDVAAIDLPGNGSLHRQASASTVEAMAEQCRVELARRGIAPPYHLLAMSLGAMVAVAMADRRPDDIAASVLINTSLRPFSPIHRRLRPGSYPSLIRLALHAADAGRCEQIILELTSRRFAADPDLIGEWTGYRNQQPVSRANALRQLTAAATYRSPAAAPCPRTLVLASTRDALVHPDCSRQLARRWQVPIAEHPDAGHDLPLDDGPWVAQRIHAWLRTLDTPEDATMPSL